MKNMKDHYSFENAIPNPYMAHLTNEVTIHLDDKTIAYLKEQEEALNIPLAALISMHLSNCANLDSELCVSSTVTVTNM